MSATRIRVDRCPGVARPWPATDGLLVRLRLVGGAVSHRSLQTLLGVAERFGDGRVHVTSRANLQVRGLPGAGRHGAGMPSGGTPGAGDVPDGGLVPEVRAALEETGLLPSATHELVRNVLGSPQTGLAGGRADLRPVAARLDTLLCARPSLARLPGRFLFVLDDGRGDLLDRAADLGLVALDTGTAQLRVGAAWGPLVQLDDAAATLVGLAARFQARRGDGPGSAWHVAELAEPLVAPRPADRRMPASSGPLPHGPVAGGHHVAAPAGGLDRAAVENLLERGRPLVVTPWRGVLVVGEGDR
ncbi:MAG: precorrin-3B synthase [Phycicoccus sp.]